MVTSAKGGVGKSTVCANLGAALAMSEKRVLLIDCDEANRCLDLMMGLESTVTAGLIEVLRGSIPYRDAITALPSLPSLFLLPGYAHFGSDEIPHLSEEFAGLVKRITHESGSSFDYIIIDTPGGNPDLIRCAASVSERALVVSTEQATSVRSAAGTSVLLSECGIPDVRLIINQFFGGNTKRQRLEAEFSLVSMIDEIGVQLLGVIPYDRSLWKLQNAGLLINDSAYSKSTVVSAFRNISARILWKNVPLFSGIKGYS